MGIDTTLAPRLIHNIVQSEEAPLRNRSLDSGVVGRVFRYGAEIGSSIHRFDRLERGMDYARRMIRDYEEKGESFSSGAVILADELTGGRGRFTRYWHAPKGGLWMTLVLVNTLLPEYSRLYPLAAGVACCEAIRHYLPDARTKWVNDVHVHGRKIAGILSETMIGPKHGEEYILIGVGINVNNDDFPEELAPLAVSMNTLLGARVDIDRLAAQLLAKLSWNIGLLHYDEEQQLVSQGLADREEQPGLLLAQWRRLSDTIGRRVLFGHDVQSRPQYEAEVVDVDCRGNLILKQLADGGTVVENSGEIVYLD